VALHNLDAIGQFDKVRLQIPVMYGTEQIYSMFSAPSDGARSRQLKTKRLAILTALEEFQFSKMASG
jgi:hypothetical protein